MTNEGNPQASPPVPPAVVERYEYDPYGRTYIENGDSTVRRAVSKYGNPFAWTGQRYDAGVKLYGFFARAYSPELGRWLQRDPLGFVDGVNLYEYVRSMPTTLTDPLGLAAGYACPMPPTTSPLDGGDDDGPPDEDGPTAEPCPTEDGESKDDNKPDKEETKDPPEPDETQELTIEQLIEILNWIKELCPWLSSWIDSIISRIGEDAEWTQQLIARLLLSQFVSISRPDLGKAVVVFPDLGGTGAWELAGALAEYTGASVISVDSGESFRRAMESGFSDIVIIAHGTGLDSWSGKPKFGLAGDEGAALVGGENTNIIILPADVKEYNMPNVRHVELYACYQGYGGREAEWQGAFGPEVAVETHSTSVRPWHRWFWDWLREDD